MSTEPKIISDFPKCPWCGSEETVSQKGCANAKEKAKIPKEVFTSLKREIIPVEQPVMAGLAVECIMTSFDICAGCGRERCTRAELIQAPIQAKPQVFRNLPGQKGRYYDS
jgi:predicted Fe-S protein YdhL (DUF1289 family)